MLMKRIFTAAAAVLLAGAVGAQTLKPVKLNTPSKDRGASVMKALSDRRSEREFADRALSLQDLSDLLWAANGVNRPDGRRTAPSARNNQDIDVYAVMPQGAYVYDASAHELRPVAEGDHRALVADRQPAVKDAPVFLVIMSDLSRFKGMPAEMQRQWGALDAGIVSQNISIFCSGCGFNTVPRAYMNKDELKKVLKLSPSQEPMLNNPVGYPKK